MQKKNIFPFIRLLRPLVYILVAKFLLSSFAWADPLVQTIGYDPILFFHDPSEHYKIEKDLVLKNLVVYVPFAFDFDGESYSLNSVRSKAAGTAALQKGDMSPGSTGADVPVGVPG